MTTEESTDPDLLEGKRASLICALCLEVFKSPKILPCFHTFCQPCLSNLCRRHESGVFPCPHCRRGIRVPSGGVAAFQNNFHIHQDDLEKARAGAVCPQHPTKDLDLYCPQCHLPMCVTCFMDEHREHGVLKLEEGHAKAKEQLKEDEKRLKKANAFLLHQVDTEGREHQTSKNKVAALEKVIKRKHSWLTAMVDKLRDDALASLTSYNRDTDFRHAEELGCKQSNLKKLQQLQKELQEGLSSGATGQRLLAIAKEMREGRGSPEAVSELTAGERHSVRRAVLGRKVTNDVITTMVKDFYGAVEEMEMKVSRPWVKIAEQFNYSEEKEEEVEVFSLCPEDAGDRVVASFAWRGLKEDAPSVECDSRGMNFSLQESVVGKRSWKSRGGVKAMYTNFTAGRVSTFDKSLQTNFLMTNDLSKGQADIKIANIISEDPYKSEDKYVFTINVAAHRAFAVDSSGEHFVVLEEPEDDDDLDARRAVRLYRRDHQDPVDTYEPPSDLCRLYDVCFWQAGTEGEVLIVADDGTDSLHMVDVHDGKFSFRGYLAAGCPLIVQPTALNTDTRGRLWVAFRGGKIFTFTPAKDSDLASMS